MSQQAENCVNEQLKSLAAICDLDSEVLGAFKTAMLPIVERHMASNGSAPASSAGTGDKIKLNKKGGVAKPRKTKAKVEGDISAKNPYHFYVAAQMTTVKGLNIAAKQRMSKIGEMWKATAVEDRAPYKSAADVYNAHVTEAKKADGWVATRDSIIAAANSLAQKELAAVGVHTPVDAVLADQADAVEQEEEQEAEEQEEEEEEVATPVVVAVPVKATPAPVQAAAAAPAPAANVFKRKTAAKK
jgi:hypothetical protein